MSEGAAWPRSFASSATISIGTVGATRSCRATLAARRAAKPSARSAARDAAPPCPATRGAVEPSIPVSGSGHPADSRCKLGSANRRRTCTSICDAGLPLAALAMRRCASAAGEHAPATRRGAEPKPKRSATVAAPAARHTTSRSCIEGGAAIALPSLSAQGAVGPPHGSSRRGTVPPCRVSTALCMQCHGGLRRDAALGATRLRGRNRP